MHQTRVLDSKIFVNDASSQSDFANLSMFDNETFDAAYGIESFCHLVSDWYFHFSALHLLAIKRMNP